MNKDQILEAIENMTVLELSELVKAMEEKFGVSAAAPVAVAAVLHRLPAAVRRRRSSPLFSHPQAIRRSMSSRPSVRQRVLV